MNTHIRIDSRGDPGAEPLGVRDGVDVRKNWIFLWAGAAGLIVVALVLYLLTQYVVKDEDYYQGQVEVDALGVPSESYAAPDSSNTNFVLVGDEEVIVYDV